MDERATNERATNERGPLAWSAVGTPAIRGRSRRAAGVIIAGLLAMAALAIMPAGQPTNGSIEATTPMLIGEHSALGERQVDARNRANASMGVIRGEHAGISRADYRAESAASQPWPR
jgi:hypothetical protein